jgi:hypothetical protein
VLGFFLLGGVRFQVGAEEFSCMAVLLCVAVYGCVVEMCE